MRSFRGPGGRDRAPGVQGRIAIPRAWGRCRLAPSGQGSRETSRQASAPARFPAGRSSVET